MSRRLQVSFPSNCVQFTGITVPFVITVLSSSLFPQRKDFPNCSTVSNSKSKTCAQWKKYRYNSQHELSTHSVRGIILRIFLLTNFYLFNFCPYLVVCGILSSLTRDQIHNPCIGRGSLNQWKTGEVPLRVFLYYFINSSQQPYEGGSRFISRSPDEETDSKTLTRGPSITQLESSGARFAPV